MAAAASAAAAARGAGWGVSIGGSSARAAANAVPEWAADLLKEQQQQRQKPQPVTAPPAVAAARRAEPGPPSQPVMAPPPARQPSIVLADEPAFSAAAPAGPRPAILLPSMRHAGSWPRREASTAVALSPAASVRAAAQAAAVRGRQARFGARAQVGAWEGERSVVAAGEEGGKTAGCQLPGEQQAYLRAAALPVLWLAAASLIPLPSRFLLPTPSHPAPLT
jgi:hypothetical protein